MKELGEAERELVADYGWQRAQGELTYQHAQWCLEPLSDHPLFRALVLMGGCLAVGCGGIARGDAPPDTSVGGSGIMLGVPTVGVSSVYHPSCPYEQWDCRRATSDNPCYLNLKSKDDPFAAGCSCDSSRPTSAADCKSDEVFVCRQASPPFVKAQPEPSTWDGTLHVQCACAPAPAPSFATCDATCAQLFGDTGEARQCNLISDWTCDASGACTTMSVSADVLRQGGIMCGCGH